MTDPHHHWNRTLEMLRAYRESQVLMTAAQLGVFARLADGEQTAAELAEGLGADRTALRRLLDAAVSLGLLQKDGDRYRNSPLASACLVPGSDYYLGRLAQREGAFYRRWSHLPQAVRSGQRPEENVQDEAAGGSDWVREFELALYELARVTGPVVAEALPLPEDRPLRVLDVGGGHGGYSMALARRYPQLSATVYELPAAAEVASDIIAAEGMSERVDVQVGDFQKEELGSGYDLLLLFGVLVSETDAGKVALLHKCRTALKPGGLLAIRNFCLDETRTGPGEAPLFSLHMLLSTDAGDLATEQQFRRWLLETGFSEPRTIELPVWTSSSLYLATRVA
jgi:SAM-dependent methyltransferase